MLGVWYWETPGAQSDLTLPFLISLSFPSLPHQYMTTNDSWNFCMQECTHVKCFLLHHDLSSKVASCKSFCLCLSCPWPWWVLALGGAAVRLSEKSQGGQAESILGCSISLRPPRVLCTGGEPVTLRCPPLGASCSSRSLAARCPLARTLIWGFILILLVCVCFLQGKKKKRKRDKQPGETNGK